jgi:hypothetical protein
MANEQPHFNNTIFRTTWRTEPQFHHPLSFAYDNNMSVTVPPTVGIDNIFHNFVAKVQIQTQLIKE